MIFLETIAVAFSMYSALPMPQFEWTSGNMKYALCAFPLIGVVIGLLEFAANQLCFILRVNDLVRAAALCLIPVLVTGGIHLDGYCDTSDALASHAEPAEKLEIMKDSHIGSFAVIRLCCYFILCFAFYGSLKKLSFYAWVGIFMLSRALSGLAVCSFPLAKNTGLAHLFAAAADRKHAAAILLGLCVFASFLLLLNGISGFCGAAAAFLCFAAYYHTAVKQFGGITGDLAGWFLQRAELFMLAAICLVQAVLVR